MGTVLRGLYDARVNFLYLRAGIFTSQQPPVDSAQCSGVSVFAPNLDEAVAQSGRTLAALKAALSGAYRQIRLKP